MKCKNCGAECKSEFCEHCGSPMEGYKEAVQQQNFQAQQAVKKKRAGITAIVAVVILVVLGVVIFNLIDNAGKDLTSDEAIARLNSICNSIDAKNVTPVKASVDLDDVDMKESLPDISKYPPQVENATENFVEIFSSTEKAGTGTDGWLVEMANKFNRSRVEVNGKTASVMVRGIASGVGMDYISSTKYTPDAFSPSNELWGEMLKAKGISVNLVEKRLTGNVTGILLSKAKHAEMTGKYGEISLKSISDAVEKNELAMGYTNPFASSSGLNFLVSTLCTYDAKNPLSAAAVGSFEKFQTNIPFVAYTTLQMRESARSGALDGFILEYQSYMNLPDLKSDYIFTPFGVRHDSPVYEIGSLSPDKKEILKQFIDFCKNEENQKQATDYGFNGLNDHQYTPENLGGDAIVQAQKVWKEKKNGENDVVAVFVADVSGSMMGEPMHKLKESLVKGSKYIGNNNSIGLVTFSDRVNINLPIGKFDLNQRSLFTGSVQNLQPGGGTAMYDGISVGIQLLMAEKEKNPDAKVMLFVLTDGETNSGHSLRKVEKMIKALRIPIYTIGYNADISALERVSQINEAASINADTDDVVYTLGNLFNAQM